FQNEEESESHIFKDCFYAKLLWFASPFSLKTDGAKDKEFMKTTSLEEEIEKAIKGFDEFWTIQTADEGRKLNANPPNPMRQT
ncbi:hypothetical protein PIB30_004972, partial [Stylosanthes scabra]|nr:hypothetical protein [Stylosanthes scabra]